MTALLLDTCAVLFIAENQPIASTAREQVIAAAADGGIFVSTVSAWEIGVLAAKRGVVFDPDPRTWFDAFMANTGVQLAALTPEIAIDSCYLPPLHADPADRMLVATARALGIPIVTRDRRIGDYAHAGIVEILVC